MKRVVEVYPVKGDGEGTATVNNHPGGTSVWWIRPWGPDGYGPWSGPMEFETPDPAPAVPTLIAPVGETTSPVTLQYESARAEWYRVYVVRGGTVVLDRWTKDATLGPQTLAPGSYRWWVGAWNAASNRTVWSAEGNFTIW